MSSGVEKLSDIDKLLIRLLGANDGEPIPQRLWLQKEVFQIAKNMPELEEFLQYQPHYRGPFSEELEQKEEHLDALGYIDKERGKLMLSDRGHELDEEIKDEMPRQYQEMIEDIKKFMNDLSKDELLTYIYYTYPEMTTESVEKSDLDKSRVEVAKKLYNKQKVSIGKASELAGMSVSDFKGILDD